MHYVTKALYYLLLFCGTLLILVTIGSLMYSTSLWYFKILDFPRLEELIALVSCLLLFLWATKRWNLGSWLFLVGLSFAIIVQCAFLYPYTPIAGKPIASINNNDSLQQKVFSIMLANVKMKNRQADQLIHIVNKKQPTFVIAMEVNTWWVNQLQVLEKNYPYHLIFPTDNTYGMCLYSKLPLSDPQMNFLNHDRVPSFHTYVELPDGRRFRFHAVHPVPPKPSKHPDNMNQKEVALIKVGHMVADDKMPSIVAGDFNDVGWSHNTKTFADIGGLFDVRMGRGLYNTFNAQSAFLRWPLDYVYASPQFRVVSVDRLPKFGSDHFPYYVQLVLP